MTPGKLTRREREVALLIAEGLSNREIATRLYISERTAESHVEQIRGKLGFRSRARIAAWVAGGGLDAGPAPPSRAAAPRPRRWALTWRWALAIAVVAVVLASVAALTHMPPAAAPASSRVTVVAGTGARAFSPDGRSATQAALVRPLALAATNRGDLYLLEGNRVRVIGRDGRITTVAGTGAAGSAGDGGPAIQAELDAPQGLAVATSGDVYVADTLGNRVRKIAPGGTITTVAGTGAAGYTGDGGAATSATLNLPTGLAIGVGGALLIADTGNNVVRELRRDGSIRTVAGTGEPAYRGDGGPAAYAALRAPCGLAVDAEGNLFVADALNQRVRRVDVNGQIATVAGTGDPGFGGDGGLAAHAQLNLASNPFEGVGQALAAGPDGEILVADALNHRLRRIDVHGAISTVAQLRRPLGVAVDPSGTVYAADGDANQVLRVG